MTPQDLLYFARAASELSSSGDIQIFPPGEQLVTPTHAVTGKAETLTLLIGEATAATLETSRAAHQAKADAHAGDAPFIDFNHEDREAAAWVKRIFWAGADPQTGGVRAEVEWSSAGQEAIAGKTFRRFSPAFYIANGQVSGAPENMGGLVNRAAFTRIQPLFAKAEVPSPSPEITTTMNPEEIAALKAENLALKEQLAALTAKSEKLDTAVQAHARKDAEAIVAAAAKDGRIAPAADVQSKWVAALLANPDSKDLLLAMAPNPALAKIVDTTTKAADTETPQALLAKFNALPREEQPAFYRAHKAALTSTRH